MLTPYQYASNTPISNIDLDGLEGVSYRVVKKDETTGKTVAIKRVIELDVYLAANEKGTKGAYTPEDSKRLQSLLIKKYNEKNLKDEAGLPVEFKFNFNSFDPEKTKPEDLGASLWKKTEPTAFTNGKIDFMFEVSTPTICKNPVPTEVNFSVTNVVETRKGVAMWQESIAAQGITTLSKIRVNPERGIYGFGHSEAHEITHFLLLLYGHSDQTPTSIDDHSLGGWMQYGTKVVDPETKEVTEVRGVDFNLSSKAAEKIIAGVPRVADKQQKE